MNLGANLAKILCSKAFSYLLGLGVGLILLYSIDKMQEKRKIEDTLQEIEAMLKALELQKIKIEPEIKQ